MFRIAAAFVLVLPSLFLNAQELNCNVSVVVTASTQIVNRKIYESMENMISEFMNSRKWTDYDFQANERIECNILVNITEERSTEEFSAKVTIQSSRPVFNTDYSSALLSHVDPDFNFEFTEYEPLQFSEGVYFSNLTSFLGFYAFIIIGLDFDSFSLKGGAPMYAKALDVLNNAQSSGEAGWRSLESNRNRYWLVENLTNTRFDPIRSVYYDYHRHGMDWLNKDIARGVKVVDDCLNTLVRVNRENPNSMLMQMFFNAKSDELANLYSGTSADTKAKALRILTLLDATRTSKYEQMLK